MIRPAPRATNQVVLHGDPSKSGLYVVINRFKPGNFSRPHFHPNDRFITVVKGTWWVATGDKVDSENMMPMPTGSFVTHFGKQVHWDGAKDRRDMGADRRRRTGNDDAGRGQSRARCTITPGRMPRFGACHQRAERLMRLLCRCLSLLALSLAPLAQPALAQTPAEFYRGKSLELYISSSVGGGYDAYARMLARHMGRFIPGNPTVVAKNMEGAGGLRLANFLYNAAPKDGTTFATIYRGTLFEPLLGGKGAQFDATKFTFIGSANNEVSVCVAWHTTGVTRFEQVLTKELVVGASGLSADSYQFPKIANGVLGTKFKIITGYPGGNDIDLAMERGEVQGRCSWSWTSLKATRRSWLAEKKINILFQMGLSKHPDLPDVPLIIDLAKSDEDRAVLKLMFARQVDGLALSGAARHSAGSRRGIAAGFHGYDEGQGFPCGRGEIPARDPAGRRARTSRRSSRQVYGTPAAITERAVEPPQIAALRRACRTQPSSSRFRRLRRGRPRMQTSDGIVEHHRQHAADHARARLRRDADAPSWARPNS